MIQFKYQVFVYLVRKLIRDPRVKSEVIFRQFSNDVLSAKKQIIFKQSEGVSAVNNENGKLSSRFISEQVDVSRLPANSKNGAESIRQMENLSSLFEIHREDFEYDDALHGFTPKLPKALDPSTEDLSDLGTNPRPSFNIAAYADKSPTIQEFVKLGVELWKFDRNPELARMLISLDFQKDVKPYIIFLHDCGVPADRLGVFITKNPYIFKADIDDLHTRIRYLRAHKFDPDMIATMLIKNPCLLNFSTQQIDTRLGYFQHEFKLQGSSVRQIAVKMPKLITYKMMSLEKKTFAFEKEMGFELKEMQKMLVAQPRLWTKCKRNLVESFDYAHNKMKLTHEIISKQPELLFCRQIRLERRHTFLVELNRAQYDPLKPMYVSPKAFVSGTDADFCENVAGCSLATYIMFLKTL